MSKIGLVESFRCAGRGFADAFRRGRNLRIESACGAAVVALGLYLDLSRTDWAVLVLTIAAVLAAEMANSALEFLVDLLSPERREAARLAKDIAAGTVLLLSGAAVIVGGLILGPGLWEKLS